MKMNLEIVEFYPLDLCKNKEILTGTLRVRLIDFGIHILGIFVSRRKDSWHFSMPGQKGINHKTGEVVRFPLIVFEDRERNRELLETIRKKGRLFIEQRLANIGNPISIPQKKEKAPTET